MPNTTVLSSNADASITLSASSATSLGYVNHRIEKFIKIRQASSKSNAFSLLKKIAIKNTTDNDIYGASLVFSFDVDSLSIDPIPLTCVQAHKITDVESFNLNLSSKYLYELTEAIPVHMDVRLVRGGETLASASLDIKLLPVEQIGASSEFIPESLASFVTPNDDAVKELANKAASILQEKYGTSSFTGYQTHDPDSVLHELDALYLALQKEGIHYSNPPASFEKTIQRVRMPHVAISEKTATCLDFSLLFAALCESIGFNPLLIVVKGHAFNAVWLDDYHYPNAVSDNLTVLTNDASSTDRRLVIVDPTCASSGNLTSFAEAMNKGQANLGAMAFDYCLDILSARLDSVLPLPTPHIVGGKTEIDYDDSISVDYDLPSYEQSAGSLSLQGSGAKSKFDVWEENLLDLEMSNNLINHKIGASSIQLGVEDVFRFFEDASTSDKLSVIPDNELTPSDPKKFLSYQFSLEQKKQFKSALSSSRVYAYAKRGDAEDVLISLARKSSTQIEESGCNPLFLTLGMVHWYDSNLSKLTIAAPIILVPASLPRRRVGPYFSLDLDFDSMQLNAAAFEYFKRAFDLDFSELDGFFDSPRKVDDIKKLFNTIREKIASKGNWVVDDGTVTLSLFSFAHFVMWNDMKTHRDLFIKNKVVASMVHGQSEFEQIPEDLKEENLDDIVSPSDLAIPLSADSSQLLAIKASDLGLSFVLDGPPGTGKSQTIANIIVNAMYKGKKVLFVAEKEVALDVVKSRLDALSLGRFCLQIHSAKANKKDVLSQLGESLSTGRTREAANFEQEAIELKRKRDSLNAILNEIHKKGSYFVSPYAALIKYLENEKSKGNCTVESDYAVSMDEAKYKECLDCLEDLAVTAHPVNGYYGNPFLPFSCREYSLTLRERLSSSLPEVISSLNLFAASYAKLGKKLGFGFKLSKKNAAILKELLLNCRQNPDAFLPFLVEEDGLLRQEAQVRAYFEALLVYLSLKEEICKVFNETWLLDFDAQGLKDHLIASKAYGFFAKSKAKKKVKKSLKSIAKGKVKGDLVSILDRFILLQTLHHDLEGKKGYANLLFPNEEMKTYEAVKGDYDKVKNTIELLHLLSSLDVASTEDYKKAFKKVASLLKKPEGLYAEEIDSFLNGYEEVLNKNASMKDEQFDLFNYEDNDVYFTYAHSQLTNAYKDIENLGQWCRLLLCLDKASSLLPPSLIEGYKQGRLSISKLRSSFDCALFYAVVSLSLSDLGLTNLSSLQTDQQIAKYKEALSAFQRLSVEETAHRITEHFPRSDVNYAESSLAYQLRKLVKTSGRGKTLRSIIDQYGEDIFRLCPCFLMSPLSVAQYLDPTKHHFDLVIFDEASQIPTSESIGAIARGDSTIIAGDQQQMPPTNFFTSSLSFSDERNDDVVVYQDLESLLDDAIALNLPRYRLSWHYRSHHESLIAFSNNRFYDNTLCTFPTPFNLSSQVKLVQVNGNYEKGRGVNREEAKAIVNEVIRRVKDEKMSQQSIGIVTFNKKQQDLITDMLEQKFDANPKLNRTPGGEEIFVKNLENVQGDERDVILFSICFGPDKKTKKMNLNFGPLSREKGERRLNVAVSRAKEEMIVFCSCKPEDIRAYSAKNGGAEFLKSFLLYARDGVSTLSNSSSWDIKESEISIAHFLASDLIRDGYLVDVNVGSSAFKVDLAIKDPLNQSQYALGVICDGPSYSEASYTCDDRNVVAPGVLESLSWRLMRVWSVEYLDHPGLVVRQIEKELSAPRSAQQAKKEAVKPVSLVKATPDNPYPHKIDYPNIAYPKLTNMIRDLQGALSRILAEESPISESLLKKRIREIYSLKRIDGKVMWRIQEELKRLTAYGELFDNETYWWASSLDPSAYSYYRVGGEREIGDISRQEIMVAKEDIEAVQGDISQDDLIHAILDIFGFSVMSERAKTHIVRALHWDDPSVED